VPFYLRRELRAGSAQDRRGRGSVRGCWRSGTRVCWLGRVFNAGREGVSEDGGRAEGSGRRALAQGRPSRGGSDKRRAGREGCDGHGVASPQPLDPTHRAATEREELGWTGKRGVALKAIIDEERETPDLRRAKAAPCFSVPFWSLQNNCKRTHFPHDAFLAFSGHLLGLLHCCCTLLPIIEVFPCIVLTDCRPSAVRGGSAPEFLADDGSDFGAEQLDRAHSLIAPSCPH
jgi:hypothetical protein